jgi:hypothetical protein
MLVIIGSSLIQKKCSSNRSNILMLVDVGSSLIAVTGATY